MIISPYQSSIVQYDLKPFQVNLDLVANVLDTKQKQFDTTYKHIQSLKRQALNINFLNKKKQSKVDTYNKQIDNYFTSLNEEFGDLSNPAIANGHIKIFNQLGKDTSLLNRYKTDSKLQQEYKQTVALSRSKDPVKAGFHPLNFANYQRRLNDYANMDLDQYATQNPTSPNPTVKGYTKYIDIWEGAKEAALDVPEEEITRFIQDGKGGMIKQTTKMRDPIKVQQVISQYLSSNGATQLAEEAEYFHYANRNNPQYHQELYDQSQTMLQGQKLNLQNQIKALKQYPITDVAPQIAQLESQIKDIDIKLASPNDFMNKTDEQLVNYLQGVHANETVGKMTNAYSYKNTSQEWDADPVYWESMKLQRLYNKDAFDMQYKREDLALKRLKIMAELGTTGVSTTTAGTYTENADMKAKVQGIFDTAKYLNRMQKSYIQLGVDYEDLGEEKSMSQEMSDLYAEMARLGYSKSGLVDQKKVQELQAKINKLKSKENLAQDPIDIMMKNARAYDNTELKNAPEIIAIQEAIESLKDKKFTITKDKIKSEVDRLLQDPASRAYKQKIQLKNSHTSLNSLLERGKVEGLSEEEQKKVLEQYLQDQNIVPVMPKFITDFETADLTPAEKANLGRQRNAVKTDLMNTAVFSPTMPVYKGATPINPGSIETENIMSITHTPDGFYQKINLNPDMFEDEEIRYVAFKNNPYGNFQIVSKANPTLIIQKSGSVDTFMGSLLNRIPYILDIMDEMPTRLTQKGNAYQYGKYENGTILIKTPDKNMTIDPINGSYTIDGKQYSEPKLKGASDQAVLQELDKIL